jgi:hypothetical protein
MVRPRTNSESVRAFDNPWLERSSRVHPLVPICVWGPVALALAFVGYSMGVGAVSLGALVLLGTLAWTLTEYLLHRWIFHWQPSSPRAKRIVYPIHGLHHDVQEWDRLVAPPLMAVPLWLLFLGLAWLVVGSPTVFPFFAGFTIGYQGYDYIHFYTHFGKPRSRIGRGLRRRHLQHHFACPGRWYGVSSPLWDFVFRTHVLRGKRAADV